MRQQGYGERLPNKQSMSKQSVVFRASDSILLQRGRAGDDRVRLGGDAMYYLQRHHRGSNCRGDGLHQHIRLSGLLF